MHSVTPSPAHDGRPVVVAALRTPIGTAGGALAAVPAADLAAPVLRALADAVPLPVQDVVLGNCTGPGGDVARVSALAAGLGHRRPGAHRGPPVRLRARGRRRRRGAPAPGRDGAGRRRRVRVDRSAAVLARRPAGALRAGTVRSRPARRPRDGLRRGRAGRQGRGARASDRTPTRPARTPARSRPGTPAGSTPRPCRSAASPATSVPARSRSSGWRGCARRSGRRPKAAPSPPARPAG